MKKGFPEKIFFGKNAPPYPTKNQKDYRGGNTDYDK